MRITTIEKTPEGTKELTQETLSKIKLEKNSKGYNWEISLDFNYHDPASVEKMFKDLQDYDNKLRILYSKEDTK